MEFKDLKVGMGVVDLGGNKLRITKIYYEATYIVSFEEGYFYQLNDNEIDYEATAKLNSLPKLPINGDEPSYKTISSTVYTDYNRGTQDKPKSNMPCDTCERQDRCKGRNGFETVEGMRKMANIYGLIKPSECTDYKER